MAFRHIKPNENGYYIAVIGDEDTVTGLLLTGIGQFEQEGPNVRTNFLIVRNKTTLEEIEKAFQQFTQRDDIAILLINQHIANQIRSSIDKFDNPLPAIVEIPSKDHPYKPEEDPVFVRVSSLLGLQ